MKTNRISISLLLIITLLSIQNSNAQNFSRIDEYALKTTASNSKSVEALAAYLNEGAKNDLEKVRAYYIWLTHNISYDTKTFFSSNPNPKVAPEEVLKRKISICQGYSALFKALCDYSQIPCFLVSGYSKGYGFNPKQKLSNSNHAWNTVYVDKKWLLIDATWGAGYVDNNQNFVKKFGEEYFLTTPSEFILKHLPTDPMWQLLNCPISADDYLKTDDEIRAQLNSCTHGTFMFNDTIAAYVKLNSVNQQIVTAERSLRFNPDNFEVAGFAYLNLGFELSQDIPALYESKKYNEALDLNKQVLDINEKAYTYLNKGKSDQSKNAAAICKQNMDTMKKNIKDLESFLKQKN